MNKNIIEKNKFAIGDKIITGKNFHPITRTGVRDLTGERFRGFIFDVGKDYALVVFDKKTPFTHDLGGVLSGNFGYAISYEDLEKDNAEIAWSTMEDSIKFLKYTISAKIRREDVVSPLVDIIINHFTNVIEKICDKKI